MRLKTNNKILVTGGAGYIGSHTCKVPGKAAYLPIAFDNPVDGSTHGDLQSLPISEDHIQTPDHPYGQSKLIVEKMLREFDTAYGLKSISLRYFNAAGADPDGETGEDHTPETHLIPLVLDAALGSRPQITIHGLTLRGCQDIDHVIHVCSSSEVFGRVPRERLPINEDCPFHPASPYAISKIGTDLVGRFHAEAYDQKVVKYRKHYHV